MPIPGYKRKSEIIHLSPREVDPPPELILKQENARIKSQQ